MLHEFSFPALDSSDLHQLQYIEAQSNAVSVHVRRSDYLKPYVLQHHGLLPLSYYKRAIEKIEEAVKDAHYFIFSDDAAWCKTNFTFLEGRHTFIHGNNGGNAWKDMCLMSHCRHHIVANSSFSWWGAWLSQKQGFNLAPYRWFNPDAVTFHIHDFIPATWQVVTYD